ncbi:MAG: hypothetical protein KC414_04810, partial [Romboutsia sp.]|nr:hypothetical protein [Romboutsia sp.]
DKRQKINRYTINDIAHDVELLVKDELSDDKPRQYYIDSLYEALNLTEAFMDFFISEKGSNNNVYDYLKFIKEVTQDKNNSVILSSIHRSKGRETNITWYLHPEAVEETIDDSPSGKESRNLALVAITRHKQTLNVIGTLPLEYPPFEISIDGLL